MHPPIPNSYWIRPGRLLAGEHPDGGDPQSTRDRLQQLIASGIRHFFDLTQGNEMPDYRGMLPEGVSYHSFPIPDHSLPGSVEVMRAILARLDETTEAGDMVYLHCRAGIGRTGMAAGCYLRELGATPDSALDELNRLWQQNARAATWPTVPETDAQHEYVRTWVPLQPGTRSTRALLQDAQLTRFRGCLAGLALAEVAARDASDALARDWGEQTGMTLCVAESLLARGGFDGRDQLRRYARWAQDPAAARAAADARLPESVRAGLTRALRSNAPVSGSHDPKVIDAAPLARSAAAAMYSAANPPRAIGLGGDLARVTHQVPAVVDACRLFTAQLVAMLAGGNLEDLLKVPTGVVLPLRPEVLDVAKLWANPPGGRRAVPPGILGCLDRAVRATLRTEDFLSGLDRLKGAPGPEPAAALAAYGALAGARFGETGLPASWRRRLAGSEPLEAMAESLFVASRTR